MQAAPSEPKAAVVEEAASPRTKPVEPAALPSPLEPCEPYTGPVYDEKLGHWESDQDFETYWTGQTPPVATLVRAAQARQLDVLRARSSSERCVRLDRALSAFLVWQATGTASDRDHFLALYPSDMSVAWWEFMRAPEGTPSMSEAVEKLAMEANAKAIDHVATECPGVSDGGSGEIYLQCVNAIFDAHPAAFLDAVAKVGTEDKLMATAEFWRDESWICPARTPEGIEKARAKADDWLSELAPETRRGRDLLERLRAFFRETECDPELWE